MYSLCCQNSHMIHKICLKIVGMIAMFLLSDTIGRSFEIWQDGFNAGKRRVIDFSFVFFFCFFAEILLSEIISYSFGIFMGYNLKVVTQRARVLYTTSH